MEIGYDIVLKSHAKVQAVKLFTKASQCRFGWEGSKIATNEDVVRGFPQSCSGAFRAGGPSAVPAQHHSELNLIAFLFQVFEERIQPLKALSAIPYNLLLFGSEFAPWRVDGNVIVSGREA